MTEERASSATSERAPALISPRSLTTDALSPKAAVASDFTVRRELALALAMAPPESSLTLSCSTMVFSASRLNLLLLPSRCTLAPAPMAAVALWATVVWLVAAGRSSRPPEPELMFQLAASPLLLPIQALRLVFTASISTWRARTWPSTPAWTLWSTVLSALAPLAPTMDALVLSTFALKSVTCVAWTLSVSTASVRAASPLPVLAVVLPVLRVVAEAATPETTPPLPATALARLVSVPSAVTVSEDAWALPLAPDSLTPSPSVASVSL